MHLPRGMSYPILVPIRIPTKDLPWYKALVVGLTTRKYRLYTEYKFTHNGVTYIIPKDFIFDGASIPRLLWPLLHPTGILLIPGLIHDFGYRYDTILTEDGILVKPGRKVIDQLFRDVGSHVNGLVGIDYLAYGMLRTFGWLTWKKRRKLNLDWLFDFPLYKNLSGLPQ